MRDERSEQMILKRIVISGIILSAVAAIAVAVRRKRRSEEIRSEILET